MYVEFLGQQGLVGDLDTLASAFDQKIQERRQNEDSNNQNKCSFLPFASCVQTQKDSSTSCTTGILDDNVGAAGRIYSRISTLNESWKHCCDTLDNPLLLHDVIEPVCNLMEAQGLIFRHGDFIFFQPKFVTEEIIRPLVDHKLTIAKIRTPKFQHKLQEYVDKYRGAGDKDDLQENLERQNNKSC